MRHVKQHLTEERFMFTRTLVTSARAALFAVALVSMAAPASAQQPAQPSPAAIAIAKELITLKGAAAMFTPIVAGVIMQVKGQLLQSNVNLAKELDEVALQLARELNPRVSEIFDTAAKLYASQFTEQELKDVLAFYKTPAGQKVIIQEPRVLDQSVRFADEWASKLASEVIDKMRTEMKKKGHDL
jgi:hypothetical protein